MQVHILAFMLLAGLLHGAGALLAATRRPASSSYTKKTTVASSKKTTLRKKKSAPKYKPAPPVDPTEGDNVDGEDLEIRRAAVEALGTMNGSVVVVDPSNGRVLSIVNQKLAFQPGFTPCSTIKLVTSLAALTENIVARDTF